MSYFFSNGKFLVLSPGYTMRDFQESTDVFCVLSARASSADSKCMGRATLRGRPGNHGQSGQSVDSVQEIPDSQDEPVPMKS